MRFQVLSKTFRLNGWITQRITQWVTNHQPVTEKARVPKVLQRNRGIFSLRRLAEQRRWQPKTSETGTQQLVRYLRARYQRDTYEQSWQACTALAVESLVSAHHHATAVIDHTRVSGVLWSDMLQRSEPVTTCLWPSLEQMPGSSCNNRLVIWQTNEPVFFDWFDIQRETDKSQLTKPEVICLTDIRKVNVQTKVCHNRNTRSLVSAE